MAQLQSARMDPPVRPSTRTRSRDIVLFLPVGGKLVLCSEDAPGVPKIVIELAAVEPSRMVFNAVLGGRSSEVELLRTFPILRHFPLGLKLHNPYPLFYKTRDGAARYKMVFQVPPGYSLHHHQYLRQNDQ